MGPDSFGNPNIYSFKPLEGIGMAMVRFPHAAGRVKKKVENRNMLKRTAGEGSTLRDPVTSVMTLTVLRGHSRARARPS